MIRRLTLFAYVIIGFFVAYNHHYFSTQMSLHVTISATLAVLFWPLVLLGVNLHVT